MQETNSLLFRPSESLISPPRWTPPAQTGSISGSDHWVLREGSHALDLHALRDHPKASAEDRQLSRAHAAAATGRADTIDTSVHSSGGSRRQARQRSTGAGGADAALRKRLQAASYTSGGQDWAKLFAFLDRDNSGALDVEEFTRALRKQCKIRPDQVTDAECRSIFERCDDDGSGHIDVAEFELWLGVSAAASPQRSAASPKRGVAQSPRRADAPPKAAVAAPVAAAPPSPSGNTEQPSSSTTGRRASSTAQQTRAGQQGSTAAARAGRQGQGIAASGAAGRARAPAPVATKPLLSPAAAAEAAPAGGWTFAGALLVPIWLVTVVLLLTDGTVPSADVDLGTLPALATGLPQARQLELAMLLLCLVPARRARHACAGALLHALGQRAVLAGGSAEGPALLAQQLVVGSQLLCCALLCLT